MDQELEQKLIRIGAQHEIGELRSRLKQLEDLLEIGPRPGRRQASVKAAAPAATDTGRKSWSPAMRKAAGERMKARWAAKKKLEKKSR